MLGVRGLFVPSPHHFTSVAFPLYVGMRKIRKKHWRLFAEDSIKPKA